MVEATAPLVEILEALETKQVSARELLDAELDRVERLDGPINAIVTIAPDRARSEAAAVDEARAAGTPTGRLAGAPITIKDALATEGIRSTGGATELADFVPDQDATVVQTVRREGAVVFGKTNLPRWSGDYQSYNDIFGTTNNPWNPACTPGGSSGGAAAAVSMGFTAFEIGTDIGGSIRLPSSFCGIYGHKPSFGVIPTYGYLDSVAYHRNVADVNVFGPMARSIDDLEVLFDILAGPNPDDAVGWKLDLPPSRATELADFRVAAWLDDDFCRVDPLVHNVLVGAVEALERAGARIDHHARPRLDAGRAAVENAQLIAAATAISEPAAGDNPDPSQGYVPDLSDPDEIFLPHRVWDVLHRRRGRVRQRWAEFFADVDVLLCPVAPVPAFRHVQSTQGPNWGHSVLSDYGDMPYRKLLLWASLIGGSYLPVTTPPLGLAANGLPVGIQVVAPYLHDRTALAFARCIADVVGGYQPPPPARTPES